MAIAFVTQAVGTTTVTITAASAGNVLICCVSSFRSPAARTVSSIATTNVTWTKVGNQAGGTTDGEIWLGVVAGGSSGTTVTLTMSGTGATVASNVSEYSGVQVTGTIEDGTETLNTGSSASPSTGNYTPGNNGDILITCEAHADGTVPSVQPGGIWSNLTFANNSTVCGVQGNYALNEGTSTASASWTINNVAWRTVIAGLKAQAQARSVSESISAQDKSGTGIGLTRLSEAVGAVDAAPSTSIQQSLATTRFEQIAVSDAGLQEGVGRQITDVVAVQEKLQEGTSQNLSEILSVSEFELFGTGLGLSETVSLTEALQSGIEILIVELISAADLPPSVEYGTAVEELQASVVELQAEEYVFSGPG